MNEEDLKMADADKAISILILSKWYDDAPKPKQKEGKRVCFSHMISIFCLTFLCQSSKYLTESIPVPVLPVYYLLKETLKVTGRVTVVMGHGCKFTSPSMLNLNMHFILTHHHQSHKGAVTSAKKRRKRNYSSHVLCTVPHLSYLMMSCQTGLLRWILFFNRFVSTLKLFFYQVGWQFDEVSRAIDEVGHPIIPSYPSEPFS